MNTFSEFEEILSVEDPKVAELYWQRYFREKTPMGSLYEKHKMFSPISLSKGLTLVHVTTSLNEIEKNKYMYASGGCLGASIYVVPLREDGRLHNLTEFLLRVEVPQSLVHQKREKEKIQMIAIKVSQRSISKSNLKESGFDYLALGGIQAKILRQMLDLNVFSEEDIRLMERKISEQVVSCKPLLEISINCASSRISNEDFFNLLKNSRENMPFLGYVYFETLIEIISMLQDDKLSIDFLKKGELYNWHFKNFVFDISPNLYKGFKLVNFSPDMDLILRYLEKKSENGLIFQNFSKKRFATLLRYRICQNIRLKLVGGKSLPRRLTFDSLMENNPELVGHLFHKTVREIPSLSQQHFLFEEIKAEVIWNDWNRKGVICPYNSIVPKGEMGINPRYPGLSYKMYVASVDAKTRKLKFDRELDVKLAPKLINPSISLMGASHKLPFNV